VKHRVGRPCKFVIAGDGSDASHLRNLAHDLGLGAEVVFTGMLTQAELVAPMSAADAYLSTSTYEGFGLTVVEAMASGVPAVVSDVGGHRDLVEHEVTGWVCPTSDVYVEYLVALADQPDMGMEMGNAGRARSAARFGLRSFAGEFDALYASIVP
jgi:glycosyltransferase involved in cell wall biosynthesis